jgi:hypothetical protein
MPAGTGWPGVVPVDLHPLYLAALVQPPIASLRCQAACSQQLLATLLVPQPGQAMVLELARLGMGIGSVRSFLPSLTCCI